MFHLPREQILAKLAPVFASEGVTATYRRYTGTTKTTDESGRTKNVDTFQSFEIVALVGKSKKWTTTATGPALIQTSNGTWIFREEDLTAAGITYAALNAKRDSINYGGQDYTLEDLRNVSPFVRATVKGG